MANNQARAVAKKIAVFGVALPAAVTAGVIAGGTAIEVAVVAASGKYARSELTRTKATVRRGENPFVIVAMTSPKAHLLDHDNKRHPIAPKRKKALAGPNFGPRGAVNHPGTTGKLMWERGVEVGTPVAVAAVNDAIGGALLKGFGL
ncbi:MAG: hypothetical protein NVSMB4_00560 [Acidimicrobiales bacterium]